MSYNHPGRFLFWEVEQIQDGNCIVVAVVKGLECEYWKKVKPPGWIDRRFGRTYRDKLNAALDEAYTVAHILNVEEEEFLEMLNENV